MGILSPPETSFTNHYDRARFNLSWKVLRFMVFMNLLLIISFSFVSLEETLAAVFGWIVPVIGLIILYATRKYKGFAIAFVTLGALSISATLFSFEVHHQLTNMAYMLMVVVFGFITVGRWLGLAAITVYLAAVSVYLVTYFNQQITSAPQLTSLEEMIVIFNLTVSFLVIGYMMTEFLKLYRHAEESYSRANRKLLDYSKEMRDRDQEKTIMLKEIHHRVKNNLQVITSLLRLHSNDIEDDKSRVQFGDAVNRVNAMSMIHEKMYKTENIGNLYLDDYLNDLAEELIKSYSITKPVRIEVDSTSLKLGNQTIVPLALIFNELISNSLKHAFQNKDSGIIEVFLTEGEEGVLHLNYNDNGDWKTPVKDSSFGLELINTLVEQLQGNLKRTSNGKGTRYRITMKVMD